LCTENSFAIIVTYENTVMLRMTKAVPDLLIFAFYSRHNGQTTRLRRQLTNVHKNFILYLKTALAIISDL
jgi:hypothetical protein